MTPLIIHYLSLACAMLLSSAGTAIGQGIASKGALLGIDRQSSASDESFRILLVGLAFIESGGILCLVMVLMLLYVDPLSLTWATTLSYLGITFGLGLASFFVSIASSFGVEGSCRAVARQPLFIPKIITKMLISLSMVEATVIFSFIISLLIRFLTTPELPVIDGMKYCFSGLMVGLGSIGPSIGQGFFTRASCYAVGLNRRAYQKIFAFALLNQAIIETPVIFSLLISLLIMYRSIAPMGLFFSCASLVGSLCAITFGSIGAGVGTGYIASKSCIQFALNEKNQGNIFRTNLIGQVFIESAVIYCLIVSLTLIMRIH